MALKITSSKIYNDKKIKSTQINYINIPLFNYSDLKEDFKIAKHLKAIDSIDFTGVNGVILKTSNLHNALIASQYIIRKYEQDNKTAYDFFEINDFQLELYKNLMQIKLPIIEAKNHFESTYNFPSCDFSPISQLIADEDFSNNNYTTNLNSYKDFEFPIIIHQTTQPFMWQINQIKEEERFIIYIIDENILNSPFSDIDIDEFINNLLFETNFEYIQINEPDISYYESFLLQLIGENGYKLDKKINTADIISDLMSFRKTLFLGLEDINTLVSKITKKKRKKSTLLTSRDFNIIVNNSNSLNNEYTNDPFTVLNNMIGLEDVKEQIKRLVCQLKYESERRKKNLSTSLTHKALVFMGNPGTAKTTVARLLGQILCAEGILQNNKFVEVSRKDLIGKYVGWTSNIVSEVFENAKGGTLFIDEAYSLLDEQGSAGFSSEALAEIIQQMENNPDTLVIFASYTNEMIDFIERANTGLRSRITTIIEFKDYNHQEMFDIFNYMLKQENYHIDNYEKAKDIIFRFLNQLDKIQSKNLGNGRLMRKLFKTAVEYKAINNPSDFKTINVQDLELAAQAIIKSETLLNKVQETNKNIGFLK